MDLIKVLIKSWIDKIMTSLNLKSNYKKEIKSIIKKTNINSDEIFEFDFSPHKEEFQKTFDFYKETLKNSTKYGIHSCFIYYSNYRTVNAKAGISKGNNVICFNSGLIVWLITNILNKKEINVQLIFPFSNLNKYLDTPCNELMYQQSLHFSFYHELGHIIQKSEYLEFGLLEQSQKMEEFDLTRHKLEMDADEFSSINMGSHIYQYGLKMFEGKLNKDKLESLLLIFTTGLLLYFISFSGYQKQMYYEENTHPHPIIRILIIIMTMTHYLNQYPKNIKQGIILNPKEILKKTIVSTCNIEENVFHSKKSYYFLDILKKERKEILEYYGKLKEFIPNKFILSVDKWNNIQS